MADKKPPGPTPIPDPIRNPSPEALEAAKFLKPHQFERITDPDAGKIDWLIDGLIPRGDAVLWAATWKTAKTLCAYRLVLDVLQGKPVWGRFKVDSPLRVAVFQFEMPAHEDDRRFRRLSLGCGLDPAKVQDMIRFGQFSHFSRPQIDLVDPHDIAMFLAYIGTVNPDLVIIDSVVAAFCSAELNDNPTVRRVLSRVINPLTSMGISVLLLHHFRKMMAMEHHPDKKSAVMGAAQFGAATSRTYSLERVSKDNPSSNEFTVRLGMLGGWTPNDEDSTLLEVKDVEGDGTVIEAVDALKISGKTGMTATMAAAFAVQDVVIFRGQISKKNLIAILVAEKGFTERTAERGLAYACGENWVKPIPIDGSKHGEKDIIPYFNNEDGA